MRRSSRLGLLPQSYTETLDLETRRVYLRQWPALQVSSVLWRGIAIPLDAEAGPRRFGRLRAAAGRPRAAGPAAGDRSLRTVLSARTPVPRRLLSRRLRRAGRDAGDSDHGAVPDRRPCALWALGERSRRRLCRDRRGAEPGRRSRRAPGSTRSTNGVYGFSAADAGAGGDDRLRLCPAGRRPGRDSNSRPSASEPPSASASGRSRSAGRRRFPTI